MSDVVQARPRVEKVQVDSEVLSKMTSSMGEVGADQAITTALENSMACLVSMQKAWALGKIADLVTLADHLAEQTGGVGMTTYSNVARDVATCARTDNYVAVSSTLARLHRIGDRSIMAVWGLEDMFV